MPIRIPNFLPAKSILKEENIFVMDQHRAFHQDIRPLRIAILNLMPVKQTTEVQLLRLIGNTPLQIDVFLLHMESHMSKNTSTQYLDTFYHTFNEVKDQKFDGMIITGAPIETMPFEQVTYWDELTKVLEWTKLNVTNTMHICWGAQAALYYHYGIPKFQLPQKMFGVFPHFINRDNVNLLRGFDSCFYVPHSRHTTVYKEDIARHMSLETLSESEEAGVYLVVSKDGRQIFVTGHSEYDPMTLANEYYRDVNKGMDIEIPKNYFKNDDPNQPPVVTWRSHSNLLFANWLNYYVYQKTPYDWVNPINFS